jgi:hypothetical protein
MSCGVVGEIAAVAAASMRDGRGVDLFFTY